MVYLTKNRLFYYYYGICMEFDNRLGEKLKRARKKVFPKDDMKAFSIRIGVARATLQKMEKGDLSVSISSYREAANVLGLGKGFDALFELEESMFDD